MPHFDIVRKSNLKNTFRVSKVMADFDVKPEHVAEHFVGDIEYPDAWNIGVIVGRSGTGKSTIAKEIYGDIYEGRYEYSHASVIDDMPNVNINEIEKMFYAVGFGSVPSWLKPYSALSTGEKMRVDLARVLLKKDFIVCDEYTSVVDRETAKTISIAINKTIKKYNKKFVAVTCHYDVLDYLKVSA